MSTANRLSCIPSRRERSRSSGATTPVVSRSEPRWLPASVPAFHQADIWTTKAEDNAAAQTGSNPWRWRTSRTRIRHVDTEGSEKSPRATGLRAEVALVEDGSLRAIHTPGHTPGSVSVVLATDQAEIWFTGDTSFTAESMNPSAETAGIHTDMAAVRCLHNHLQDQRVLLPSHDWNNPKRLMAGGGIPV